MSQLIARLNAEKAGKKNRTQLLALVPDRVYDDGRTKQSFKDECDINKIMCRFEVTGTISHLAKWEGVYADFSDFDFQRQTEQLTRGREIFDDLPGEVRKEFGQSPAAFFKYVNDPANAEDLRKKLPALAKPGQQLPRVASPTADNEAALAAAKEPAAPKAPPAPKNPPADPPASP